MKSMHLQEQYASGTAGVTFAAAVYQTCALNTTVYNEIPGAALNPANGRVTLPAGDYEVCGSVASGGGLQRAGIFDITNSAFISHGLNNPVPAGSAPVGPYAFVRTFFHLNVQTDIELQLYRANGGAGAAVNDGQTEVYSELVVYAR